MLGKNLNDFKEQFHYPQENAGCRECGNFTKEVKYIRYFGKKEEDGQNPHIGFVSYQHFRDEELYSDVVVKPGKAMIETENYECYPVPLNVAQEGRTEGFYPDTTVAYIRILWKEFEPKQGEYHYEVIEDILAKAKAKGQTVMFRLMPHSTRACDDVPEWLKELIPCPERPDGARVKDSPTDPLYLKLFGKAIEKIAERFDDDPTLDVVDICLPGAWGEGERDKLHLYSEEALKEHVDVYTRCFKNTHLLGQVAAPWLVKYANETRPVGWRGDGTGHDEHMQEIFPQAEAQMSLVWQKSPVSFESFYWLGEWYRKGWDLDEIIELTLKWHISTFNAKNFPIPYEWQDKIKYWNSKMGYHFAIDYFKTPQEALAGNELELEWCIDNCGVAPIYRKIPLWIRLMNENVSYSLDTGVDIRTWMPGKNINKVLLKLPENMKCGDYKVEIGIMDENVPVIYFATDAVLDGAFYEVGKLRVLEDKHKE